MRNLKATLRRGAWFALAMMLAGGNIAAGQTPSPAALHVMVAGATQAVVKPLAAQFTQETGTPVDIVVGTVGMLQKRLASGEHADVVMLSVPALDAMQKSGTLAMNVPLGRTGTAVCVRSGAPVPDISTVDAFKKTMLSATSVTYTDPKSGASSGIAFAALLDRLGIGDAVNAKATLVAGGGFVCDLVAKGQVQLGVQNLTEIVPVNGVTIAGLLPADIQNYITYGAGIPASADSPDGARAFVAFLRRPAFATRWKAAGFEPPLAQK